LEKNETAQVVGA
jgi:hypothetical protein